MAIWSMVSHLNQQATSRLFTLMLAVTVLLVTVTGWYGTELVYRYGLGVQSLPQAEVSGHQHAEEKSNGKSLSNKPTETSHDGHAHEH